MEERRIDNRLLCADLVEICWEHAGQQHRRVANLEDISQTGICLQVEQSIAPATQIVIRYGVGALVGVVRYCVYREMGFFVGIEFEEGTRWSTQNYQPKHLLDTRQLFDEALTGDRANSGSTARPN